MLQPRIHATSYGNTPRILTPRPHDVINARSALRLWLSVIRSSTQHLGAPRLTALRPIDVEEAREVAYIGLGNTAYALQIG